MNKRQLNGHELYKVENMCKILKEPLRMDIINILHGSPTLFRDIVKELKVDQTLASHHIHKIFKAGWVTKKRIGKCVEYRITKECPSLKWLLKV